MLFPQGMTTALCILQTLLSGATAMFASVKRWVARQLTQTSHGERREETVEPSTG